MARQGPGNEDGHLQSPDFLCRVAHNTGAMMRRLDDGKGAKDGKPGNMYQHLGGTEEERQKNLALFKA